MPPKRPRRIVDDDEDEDGGEAGPSRSPGQSSGASSDLTPPPNSPKKSKAGGASSSKKKAIPFTSDEVPAEAPKPSLKLTLKVGKAPGQDAFAAPEQPETPVDEAPQSTKRPRPAKRKSIVLERTMTTRSQSPEKSASRASSPSKVTSARDEAVQPSEAPGPGEAKEGGKVKGKGKGKAAAVVSGDTAVGAVPGPKEGKAEGKGKSGKRKQEEVVETTEEGGAENEGVDLFGDPTESADPGGASTRIDTPDESARSEIPKGSSKKKKSGQVKSDSAPGSAEIPSSGASDQPSKTSGSGNISELKRRRPSSGEAVKSSPLARRPDAPSPLAGPVGTPGPSASTTAAGVGSTDPKKPTTAVQPKKSLPNLKKKFPTGTPSGTPSKAPNAAPTSLLSSTLASLTKAPSVVLPAVKKDAKDDKKGATVPPPPPAKKKGAWDEVWVLTPDEEAAYEASKPIRDAEKAARAMWKINPINLQEGKDAYRLETIQPRAINLPISERQPDVHGLITNGATSRMVAALLAGKTGYGV